MAAGSQAGAEARGEVVEGGELSVKRVRTEGVPRTVCLCSACNQPGHNIRTCTTEVLDSEESE
jgi:hypothetical protein